jgi:hypothetical protein
MPLTLPRIVYIEYRSAISSIVFAETVSDAGRRPISSPVHTHAYKAFWDVKNVELAASIHR